MAVISISKILRERLSDEGAEQLAQILDKIQGEAQQATLEIAEEKFEKRLAQVESKLESKIERTRADLIQWMFIFWVGQVATITAILFAFFKR